MEHRYIKSVETQTITIKTEAGHLVAVFPTSPVGQFAYSQFMKGIAPMQGMSLYDADAKQYLIGTLDQMVETMLN